MSRRLVLNPATGDTSFGLAPRINVGRRVICEPAEIRLAEGKHWGPHGGFGKKHIWAEHRTEMQRKGFGGEEDVGSYVAGIVRAGSRVHFEDGHIRKPRIQVFRGSDELAILELQSDQTWSIATAYPGRQAHGTLVGTVR